MNITLADIGLIVAALGVVVVLVVESVRSKSSRREDTEDND